MKKTKLEELSLEINKLVKTNSNPERLQVLRETFQAEMYKLVDKKNKESKPKKEPERIQIVLREIKNLQKKEKPVGVRQRLKEAKQLDDLQAELRQLLRAMPNEPVTKAKPSNKELQVRLKEVRSKIKTLQAEETKLKNKIYKMK